MEHCLDIDMGNSRTKWRLGDESGSLRSPGLPHIEKMVSRVRICYILENRESIRRMIQEQFNVEAEFPGTTAQLSGVANAYEDPSAMGIDRWLAVVAAWNRTHEATAILDAGTALTIDFVTKKGQHLGGYIVPGLQTMRRSLAGSTVGVQVNDDLRMENISQPGSSTTEAMVRGLLQMTSDFVNGAINRFQDSSKSTIRTLVTGGDAQKIATLLNTGVEVVSSLVLDGLDYALPN